MSTSALRASPRKVFAHYFTPYPVSIDNKDPAVDYYTVHYLNPKGENGKFEAQGGLLRDRPLGRAPRPDDWSTADLRDEVRSAIAIGLDGFILDLLSLSGTHFDRALQLLRAAHDVDPQFAIMLMPDMESLATASRAEVVQLIATLGQEASAMRLPDGRLVVSPYNAHKQPVDAYWKPLLADLAAKGVSVAFVPLFQGLDQYAANFESSSYGMSEWGANGPDANKVFLGTPALLHQKGLLWMMPVRPQYERPSIMRTWEAQNTATFRGMWTDAIAAGSDWVQLATWNDYSECAHIAPSVGTRHVFYDLSAYYTAWFKTGAIPSIVRDVIYYTHRTHRSTAVATQQTKPFDVSDGPLRDDFEVVAFLTAPTKLTLVSQQTLSFQAPAGLSVHKVPLGLGHPLVRLERSDQPTIEVESVVNVADAIAYEDPLYRGSSVTISSVCP